VVSCTKIHKAFSGFWETVFAEKYKLQKVKLTNLLTYLFYIFLMKFFGILGCKLAPNWTDKLFTQKSLSNCFVVLINPHGADDRRLALLVYSWKI